MPNSSLGLALLRQRLKKQKYTVDEEALKVYFPYQHVPGRDVRIYQRIFGLKFERLDAALQMGG